jgi:hypothetical protein
LLPIPINAILAISDDTAMVTTVSNKNTKKIYKNIHKKTNCSNSRKFLLQM